MTIDSFTSRGIISVPSVDNFQGWFIHKMLILSISDKIFTFTELLRCIRL